MATGSIEKYVSKEGVVSYHIRVELGPDPLTGKRRQKHLRRRTMKEAQALRTQLVAEVERGDVILDDAMTTGAWLTHWLETIVKHRVRVRTYQSYDQLLRTHLLPRLGHIQVQKLTRQHVEAMYAALLSPGGRKDGKEGGLSRRMVRFLHTVLKMACAEAVQAGLLRRNPLDGMKPPKPDPPPIAYWTAAEVTTFLSAVDQDIYGAVWHLALHTGLRVGELLGLRWEDIDPARSELRVAQILNDDGGTRELVPLTKSEHGARAVALDPATLDVLQAWRERQAEQRTCHQGEWPHPELVFPSSIGTLMIARNLARHFHDVVARLPVQRIRLHDLRHTHATLLMLAGVNPKVVSERLGHADVAFTLRIYSHVLPQMQTDAAAAFADVLQKATKRPEKAPSGDAP